MKVQLTEGQLRYILAGTAVAAIAVGGLYLFYDVAIGNLVAIQNAALWITLGFGLLTGMLSFFAPCSFALFPAYMSYYASSDRTASSFAGSLRLGVVASLGMAVAYGLISISLSGLTAFLPLQAMLSYTIPVLAVLILLLGAAFATGFTAGGRFFGQLSQRIADRAETAQSVDGTVFGFGVAYAIGSITCILPIFIVFIVAPFLTGDAFTGLLAFGSFILGKSALMVAATVLTGRSKEHLVTQLGQNFVWVRRIGGGLMIFAGLYLFRYTLLLWNVQNPVLNNLFLLPW